MSKPALNIGDLSPEERLRLIEELWDSLSETPGNVPLTNAQRDANFQLIREIGATAVRIPCSMAIGAP